MAKATACTTQQTMAHTKRGTRTWAQASWFATSFAFMGCLGTTNLPNYESEEAIDTSEEYVTAPASKHDGDGGADSGGPPGATLSSYTEAGSCSFDTEDRTYRLNCKQASCPPPDYAQAQLWTSYLLGNSKSAIHASARPALSLLAKCIENETVNVNLCGLASAVENGPPVLWLRYGGTCRDAKGSAVSPGALLRQAVDAYRKAKPSGPELGPLASWTTLSPPCDGGSCTQSVTSENMAYLDPSPAVITQSLTNTSAGGRVPGTRDGQNVTVYFWTSSPKTCKSGMRGGDSCTTVNVTATQAVPVAVKGLIKTKSGRCQCTSGGAG